MSDPAYSIRPATPADAGVIAHHRVAMFSDMGQVPTEAMGAELLQASTSALAALLQEGAYFGLLAVGPEDRIIAGAGAHIRWQLPRPASTGASVTLRPVPLMVNVYTEPQWRRRGVARALVLALTRWTTDEGFDHLVLHASEEGRALYASLGFSGTNEMRWVPRR